MNTNEYKWIWIRIYFRALAFHSHLQNQPNQSQTSISIFGIPHLPSINRYLRLVRWGWKVCIIIERSVFIPDPIPSDRLWFILDNSHSTLVIYPGQIRIRRVCLVLDPPHTIGNSDHPCGPCHSHWANSAPFPNTRKRCQHCRFLAAAQHTLRWRNPAVVTWAHS